MVDSILPFATAPPTLSDFVVGENDEILTAVRTCAEQQTGEPSIYIWGDAGCGKSCLLWAACRHARQYGLSTYYIKPSPPPPPDPLPPPIEGLLAVDDVNLLSEESQIMLFDWHNRPPKQRHFLLATGNAAPTALPIRQELATRLAGGLVFRLHSLDDSQKEDALANYAKRRGFHLPPEIARLLLSRLPRNMHSLEATLNDLDKFLLVQQKPLTLRRVSNWLTSRLDPLL